MWGGIELINPGLASCVVEELTPDTWYFAMTSLNSRGDESAFSNQAIAIRSDIRNGTIIGGRFRFFGGRFRFFCARFRFYRSADKFGSPSSLLIRSIHALLPSESGA
jgi:hypothetical protein